MIRGWWHLGLFVLGGVCLVGATSSAYADLVAVDSGDHSVEVDAAVQTVFSQVPIPEKCRDSYARGIETFHEAHLAEVLRRGDEALASHMTAALANETGAAHPDCAFFFSMGAYDAHGLLQQNVIMELFLELQAVESDDRLADAVRKARVQGVLALFRERFQLAGLEQAQVETLLTSSERATTTQSFIKELRQIARQKQAAIPFGRFVFVALETSLPLTQFEYVWTPAGQVAVGAEAQLTVKIGSYQKLAERLLNDVYHTAQDYIKWQPGILYGEDSFLHGAFWRWWRNDPYEKSIREIKEDHYFTVIRRFSQMANQLHLKMEPFRSIELHMVKKQRAYLERDIQAFDRVRIAVMAAPLVPVGMYLGAAGLAYAGMTSLPAGASTFALSSYSLAYASNLSAAVSAATILGFTGLGVKNAVDDYRARSAAGLPYRMIDVFDDVMGAAVASFPLAAALPAAIGGLAAGGKSAIFTIRSVIADGMSLATAARELGWRGSVEALRSMPKQALRHWATTWWNKRKVLLVHYAVDLSTSVVFEVTYRQFFRDGDERFTWVDAEGKRHFNENSMYSLGSGAVIGVISKPMIYIPSFAGRWLSWRAISLTGSVIAQLSLAGYLDKDKMTFSETYGAVVGSSLGEWERTIRLTNFVQSRSAAQQYALLTLLRLAIKAGETPVRVSLMEAFLSGNLHPLDSLRSTLKDWSQIDIDDMADDVLRAALIDLRAEPEVQALLERR